MAYFFHPYTSHRNPDGTLKPCATSTPPGTKALHDYIRARFEFTTSMGILNCSETAYLHRLGWAWDCGIPTNPDGSARLDLGMPIVDLLGNHGEVLGLVGMIYARRKWRKGYEDGPVYTGPHDHNNHIHIELTPYASDNLTVARLVAILGPTDSSQEDIMLKLARRHWTLDNFQVFYNRGYFAGGSQKVTVDGKQYSEGAVYWYAQVQDEVAGKPTGETPEALDRMTAEVLAKAAARSAL